MPAQVAPVAFSSDGTYLLTTGEEWYSAAVAGAVALPQ
jgi:hypothetical protein